ncbi:hypothetical protein HYN69_17935 (plasmid) [Gemmobacter aquarius]|uniref:Glycosyl transferase family 2 n=1 Tax=Paragemmobacter aquarius TaxID=2169400 RepID=A0A2S0URQ5_9RHOB|nr:glycosyltransferase family 2 protein [Gemmobacter aquarius]AWB50495.1 hypothetical protein HYN69_17935 [Gemmobacter aquarius]
MQLSITAGRPNAALPPFNGREGDRLRASCQSYEDFLILLDRAETARANDWLHWVDRAAVQRFPKDMDLVARWLLHEVLRGNTDIARTLRIVLLSLPEAEQDKPAILDALSRADFLLGHVEDGAARLARLTHFFDHDIRPVQAAQLRGLIAADQTDCALALVKDMAIPSHPDLMRAMLETFRAASQYRPLCDFVQAAGGIAALETPEDAYLYISALEALGRLSDCLGEGSALLSLYPANPHVAQVMRHVALRLDRLDEVTPLLLRSADAMAGEPAALELRALIALDADDYAKARAILKLFDDPAEESALRLRLTVATTDPATSPRAVRKAYRAYHALAVNHAGPEMQYASYLLNAARRPAQLQEALGVMQAALPRAGGNSYFHRLYLSLLIANRKPDTARAHLGSLSEGLRTSRLIREVELCFDQASGNHDGVRRAWRDHIAGGSFRVLAADTAAPTPASSAAKTSAALVTVFAVVFNGIDYLDAFFDHYRRLGVRQFVIVDNGSNDGTREYLCAQPDVIAYDQTDSFRASAHGVAWINPLIQTHAQGRWALFVDIDEHLVFPGSDQGRSIDDLARYGEQTGSGCFASFMLDMFATPASAAKGFAGHRYFDSGYLIFPGVLPPYRVVQGGVRGRLTGRQFLITKSPLVHVDPDVLFLENNHFHTHLPVAKVTTALLHYKFVGDATARFAEAVDRGEHFLGGRFYRDMLARLKGNGIRRGLWARSYRGVSQLTRMGLLDTTPDWDKWS